MPEVLWSPPADVRERSRIGTYLDRLAAEDGTRFDDYDALWRWSTGDPDAFWRSIWAFFEVSPTTPAVGLADARMPGTVWFPQAAVNYAEVALRLRDRAPDDVIVLGRSQTRPPLDLTVAELREQVARCRAGLQALGVGRGDRVAAFLPNVPEAVVALLATASLGAIWTSCAPEFGTRAVIDRFGQVEPAVLLAVDGYRYGDKAIDRTAELAEIRAALPSLRATVLLPYLDPDAGAPAGGL
ncbi:MAG TPA: AMP-binding protein, partial [Candidatus Limnocylindrales bacterium]